MDFIKEHEVGCPSCGKHNFTDIRQFNLMFKTFQGVTEDADKANALLYLLFFGLWPMLKSLLERIPARPLEWLCKLAVFNAVLSLFWFGLHSLFLPFLPETLQAPWMVYAAGNAAFVIYDVGFSKLISFYVARVDRVLRKTS